MPTFNPAALDRFIEPLSKNSMAKPPPSRIKVERSSSTVTDSPFCSANTSFPRPAIQPALYATPESTALLPTSPSSFPPSPPFVINHKRRGPSLLKSLSQSDLGEKSEIEKENEVKAEEKGENGVVEVEISKGKIGDDDDGELGKGLVGAEDVATPFYAVTEGDDFFDLQDSLSMSSNNEVEDGNGPRWWRPGTPLAEYYDAYEEIASDTARSYSNFEDELRQTRLNLLMEIERRKQAEEALETLQNKWQMLSQHLSLVGLRLPVPPAFADGTDEQVNINPVEELCQQVVVTRCVADAVSRAFSRAEVEMEMQPLIESKNFETARLLDRIHYYEAANREMCQRNQEAVEMARKARIRNKRRQKWFWGSIAFAVTVGSAAIAWSYLPASSQSSDDATEGHEN